MLQENLSEAQRLSRKSHRKVRTGCRTCKVRRVKCDEGYPACYRCVSMGRVCDGYGIWGGGGAVHRESAKPTSRGQILTETPDIPSSADKLLCKSSPSKFGPQISSEEQTYLEWFIHGTATKTPRIFNSPFWDPIILQATMNEPMVLQALLALSSVHKRKILEPAKRVRDGLVPDAQEIFLLKQYGNAIRNLQDYLGNENRPTRPRLLMAVIMCALFVLLEYTRGNFDVGFLHLQGGARLAKQLMKESSEMTDEVKLIQFFARLQDQSELYRIQKKTQSDSQASVPSPEPALPPALRFTDSIEAGNHLDTLIDMMAHSAEQARMIPHSATASRKLFEEEYTYILASFEAWLLAYNATIAESSDKMSYKDSLAWNALRQRYDMAMKMNDLQLVRPEFLDSSSESIGGSESWLTKRAQRPHARALETWIGDKEGRAVMSKEMLFVGTAWRQ